MRVLVFRNMGVCFLVLGQAVAAAAGGFLPGDRALFEAHNCYPYNGFWADRLSRALTVAPPLALELDLRWQVPAEGGPGRLIVAHDPPRSDRDPALRDYLFEPLRPLVEAALAAGEKEEWPLFTLNLNDLRGGEQAMYDALWVLTGEYASWFCTAEKGIDPAVVMPLERKPVLLLTNGGRQAEATFYDAVPVGGRLRLFGSGDPERPATNFRRWVNHAWRAVEREGQTRAGAWTPEDAARLGELVAAAHGQGYWIRFYALNGHSAVDVVRLGLSPAYNFGSEEAALARWRAAVEAGVDFIASDQYEAAGAAIAAARAARQGSR
jgi:hypothetical protein